MFGDAVRAGNEVRVAALLTNNWPNILMSELSFDLTLDRDTSLPEGSRRNSALLDTVDAGGVPDIDKVNMNVTPFHLAVIAK